MNATERSGVTSELERFAAWFHHDFGCAFVDENQGATEYLNALTPIQRATLRRELEGLLRDNNGKDQHGLRNAWSRLGAQWWPRNKDLRLAISAWIRALE